MPPSSSTLGLTPARLAIGQPAGGWDAPGRSEIASRAARLLLMVVAAFAWFVATPSRGADPYDVVIRNGRVIDGTGNPSFHADVAIKGGALAAIGKIPGKGTREIDAAGLVVAPGFIDVHTHAEDIEDRPEAENFLRMGVTTLVLGNCGSSELNLGQFFSRLEALKISPNVASLIGHGTVRSRAMHGSSSRAPTPAELEQMRKSTRQAMEDGAVGLSTGLIYTPGVFASTEEIIELAKVAAEYDGIYATHQRSESGEIFQSLDEIIRIAREAHIRVEVSHLKLSAPANWGKASQVLDVLEKARASGLDITQDQYPYTASSTGLGQLVPDSAKEGGRGIYAGKIANAESRAKCVAEMKETLRKRQNPDYSYAVIASYRANPSLNGLNVAQAALKVKGGDSLDQQIDLILDIEKNGGASAVFHGMSEEDLVTFMRHPNTMIASDSGVRKLNADVPHPRGYGTAARVLGTYVREKKVLTLEDAIRRLTSLPAQVFHFENRGQLRKGNAADVVVFDPETVADHSAYDDPHHYATGFQSVLVNGQVVVDHDKHTGSRPGKILRRAAPETLSPGSLTPALNHE